MSAALGAAGTVLLYAILRFLTSETSDFGHRTFSLLEDTGLPARLLVPGDYRYADLPSTAG
jgi:hypothetical protein